MIIPGLDVFEKITETKSHFQHIIEKEQEPEKQNREEDSCLLVANPDLIPITT